MVKMRRDESFTWKTLKMNYRLIMLIKYATILATYTKMLITMCFNTER